MKNLLSFFKKIIILFILSFIALIVLSFLPKKDSCAQFLKNEKELIKLSTYFPSDSIDFLTIANVRKTPFFWTFIPFLNGSMSSTISGKIFLPKKLFYDFTLNNKNTELEAVLIHESVHQSRQNSLGIVYWIKYPFSSKLLVYEEILAIGAEMRYRRQAGGVYDIERKTKQLSGHSYFYACKENNAKKMLELMWINSSIF